MNDGSRIQMQKAEKVSVLLNPPREKEETNGVRP